MVAHYHRYLHVMTCFSCIMCPALLLYFVVIYVVMVLDDKCFETPSRTQYEDIDESED